MRRPQIIDTVMFAPLLFRVGVELGLGD
jgi:hypothetical protein